MKPRVFCAAAGLAFAVAASAPAEAQFMTSYPAIIVVPPPAQNYVMPKPAPKPTPAKPITSAPPPDTQAPNVSQCYQGRTRVCP